MSILLSRNLASALPSAPTGQLELSDAVGVLERHADNPSAFLTLNADTLLYQMPGVDGFIAYRPAGRRHVVQLGGVFAAEAERDLLLNGFRAMAGSEGRRVVCVQLMRD